MSLWLIPILLLGLFVLPKKATPKQPTVIDWSDCEEELLQDKANGILGG